MRDPRRHFSRQDVWRSWHVQGCICKLCGRAIPFDLMVGDHIVPWSRGGPTTLENLQALCGSCNLRKGSDPQKAVEVHFDVDQIAPSKHAMRKWQTAAMPVVLRVIGNEPVLID